MDMNLKTKIAAVSGVVALLTTIGAMTALGQGQSEIQAGLAAHPSSVPLNLQGLNLALVARGSYVVNGSAGCTGCHTVGARYLTGGNPFFGEPEMPNTIEFLGGKRSFAGGTIISRNLTPDTSGRPGGLTLDQFIETINTGRDLKGLSPFTPSPGHDLLQIMPWPDYRKLTENDLRAIYEYLKALPCVNGGPGLSQTRCGS
jgi:hypothetical protein